MNLQELKEYLYKYGITLDECYYEEDRRKRWYAIDYPVFSGENDMPTSFEKYPIKKLNEAIPFAEKLLADEEYKNKCIYWVTNY